jgi:co-chaperonin GroES (HSP10)
MPRIIPVTDHILCRRFLKNNVVKENGEYKLKNGLMLSESAKREVELNQGEIVAVGPSVENYKLVAGAIIYWGKNAGVNVRPDKDNPDDEYFMCAEGDILAVLEYDDEK